jgi:CO/xanthine dehydrogenase Mo-binding subunit
MSPTASSFDVNVRRCDAAEKTSGRALYTTDIALPGMLHAKALRSPRRHARIVSIDTAAARAMPGVRAVLTGDALPPEIMPYYGYFIKDQPIVAIGTVRYEGDIVAAVAADSEAQAVAALGRIRVEYADLPVLTSIEEALLEGAAELFPEAPLSFMPSYGTGVAATMRPQPNICFEWTYRTGDARAFEGCDHVFEDEFRFSRMQHFHLEPFVCVASARTDALEVWSSNQNPFPLRKELARMFKFPENRVRVNVPYVGGGFGAKNNCKTEPVAVMLSMMTGRPVRFCLSLEEGFYTNTQHAAILRLRTGVMRDGTLVARQSDILLDAGAYSDASPLVAEKAGYRIPGPYRYQHIDSRCRCVMTNTTPAGPFRGFGGTQTTWASESQIDMMARRLGIDPYDLRKRNLLALGEPYVPHESGMDSDLVAGLDLVLREIGYHERPRTPNRGIGFAIGFKDGGGINKPARARVKVMTSGDVLLDCATVEIGQGARSTLCQIAAEILAVPVDRVRTSAVDTDHTPFDQGTNASSAVVVMGRAVASAAERLRYDVLAFAAEQLGCDVTGLRLENWQIVRGDERKPMIPLIAAAFGGTGFEFSADGYFKAPLDHHAPLETPCIFWEIGWGAVDVEVDPETGKVTVHKLVISADAGKALNPLVCRGQDIGAAVMGMGQALFERMEFRDGHLLNADPLDYRIALAEDLPRDFVAITQEQGHGPGPFGSKGMGEGGMLPIAAAFANAIHDAIGLRITALPLSPQRIVAALEERDAHIDLAANRDVVPR